MNELSNDEAPQRSMVEATSDRSVRSVILTAQFENLEWIREFAADAARDCGLVPSAVYAVQLAVDEAFSNIIEHAYGGECLEYVQCTCQLTDDALVIKLRDCGKPFNPRKIPNPDLEADLEKRKIGGLGLYFMRQMMDEVDFAFATDPETGRPCNILRMMKRKEPVS